ncbi:hypothetical protein MBBA_1623 [Methanoculleus bourgensis]|jgi:hypothetical protein|nr:hypothetical protein MBBA_1623 [Methanoculleus bourgensis]
MNTTYSPGEPGQWTVVGIALGGHDGTEQGSLPVANPGISSWKLR